MTILLSALALLSTFVSPRVQYGEEIFVRTERGVPVERLASAVSPMGRIESRKRGTCLYLVRLKAGIDDEKAKAHLARIPGVHPLGPEEEPVDMTSLKSLDRKIAHLSKGEQEERTEGHRPKAEHGQDEVDYLKAYRYFIAQRAFPNDRVDWGALTRGQAHATLMPATKLGRSGTGAHPAASQTWTFVGPTNLAVPYEQYYGIGPVNGRVNAVAYDPNNSQTIYAGGAQGGLWKSTDGGTTWAWLSSSWSQIAVNCIVIDPLDSDTIYVGRGDYHGMIAGSYGLMKSTDGGSTWTEIAEATMGQVGVARILLDPTNDQTLIAGTGDSNSYGSLYRSTNGGQSWALLSVGGNNFTWPALSASVPSSGNVRFYAIAGGIANSNGAASRVYKSDDHGVTWQLLPSTIATDGNFHWAYCVAASPTNPNNVYVLDSENQILLTSSNKGASWTNVSANLPAGNEISPNYNFSQSFYDYHMECGARVTGTTSSDVLYLGEIDIAESLNGGNTWVSIGGPSYAPSGAITHNDQHCLAVCPSNPNLAVFSNDGGVYSLTYNSTSGTNTVATLNQSLGVSMFYKIALHPTNASIVLGGTQDNASPYSAGNLTSWLNEGGGDGGGSAINQTTPIIQYTSSEDLTIYRTANSWDTESDISPSPNASENLPFVCAMALAPQNQLQLYTGTNYLYQWNDTTLTWSNRLGNQDLTNQTSTQPVIQAIAVAPTDVNRIYTGSSDGALWMSTTQGTSWKKLNTAAGALPNQAITSISVSPTNSSDILIGLSGAGQGKPHLYRCANTQAATLVFTSVSGSGATALPDVSLNAIARDLTNPATTWWVGMDVGVFQTTNSGATWSNAGAALGLPNVIVDDLVAVPGTGYLNAGTYGRGMWRLLLPTQTAGLASFTLSTTTTRRGNSVTGTVTLSDPAPAGGAVVSLNSSNTAIATVPASVTISAGATSATFTVSTSASTTAPGSSTIGASYGGVQLTQVLNVAVPTISGTVTFSDYVGTPPSAVTLNFRLPGATSVFMTMSVSVAANGSFTAQNVPAEAYSVYIQTGTWLRRTLSLNLTTTDVTNADYVLINGDVDGNNRIDISDLRLLTAARGAVPGDSNWNPRADLNGDGSVDDADFAIFYKNYGKIGDP